MTTMTGVGSANGLWIPMGALYLKSLLNKSPALQENSTKDSRALWALNDS
jgi:hypothetical protein